MSMNQESGRFCWVDLATCDAPVARAFYGELFGWAGRTQQAGAGQYISLHSDGIEVASLYQLSPSQVRAGVPSHWTPYVTVSCLEQAAKRAVSLGGRVVVESFEVPDIARIGLLMDPTGAVFGIWENANGSSKTTKSAR